MTTPAPASGPRIGQLRRIATRMRYRQPPSTSVPRQSTQSPPPNGRGISARRRHTVARTSPGTFRRRRPAADTVSGWAKLERVVGLLVSASTLTAVGFTWATVHQASAEQHLTRDGQITDRYTAAVANLGDDSEEVRLGGLYALQRLALDSPRDAPTIIEVICAYVRTHAPQPKKGTKGPAHPTDDVAAALDIIVTPDPLAKDQPVDLHGANLTGAELLDYSDLSHANLQGADLSNVTMTHVDLTGALLYQARLAGGYLAYLTLSQAELGSADLREATLIKVDLDHASLNDANLDHAKLASANLTYTDLTLANLTGATLTGADLDHAKLDGATLARANLRKARLVGASLDGTNIINADLNGADLTGTRMDNAIRSAADLPPQPLPTWTSRDPWPH